MLNDLPIYKEDELVKVAYEICRWHHERYDGKGYPNGLKGDEIPISAQAVSIADAYDALISERVYKKAFSHEKAIQMILNGECGAFNTGIGMNESFMEHIFEPFLRSEKVTKVEGTG